MKRVFISSCRVDDPPAAALIERLGGASFSVSHSPRNPADGEDARWRDWYAGGCKSELEKDNVFISVITPDWDCSTWMAYECDEWLKQARAGKIRETYFWNPNRVEVKAAGMISYLRECLPDNLAELISTLKEKG